MEIHIEQVSGLIRVLERIDKAHARLTARRGKLYKEGRLLGLSKEDMRLLTRRQLRGHMDKDQMDIRIQTIENALNEARRIETLKKLKEKNAGSND